MSTFLVAVATFIIGYFLAKRKQIPTSVNVDQQLKHRIQELENQNKLLTTKTEQISAPTPAPLPEAENWAKKYRDLETKYRLECAELSQTGAELRREMDMYNVEIELLKEQLKSEQTVRTSMKASLVECQQREKHILQKHRKEMNHLCALSKADAIEHYQKEAKGFLQETQRIAADISHKDQLRSLKRKQADTVSLPTTQREISLLEMEIKALQSIQTAFTQKHSVVAEYLVNLTQSIAK